MANYKVVNADQLDADLTNIADAIREQTGKTDNIAFPEGFASAPAELVEAGRQAEYDEFWDTYQQNGNRTSYKFTFAGNAWTNDLYNPKYPMKPIESARRMFAESMVDLGENHKGVIDFSETVDMYEVFRGYGGNSLIAQTIDLSSATLITSLFHGCSSLTTIKKIIFGEKVPNVSSAANVFNGCSKLVNLGAEGTIALALSFQWCPLSLESAKSVINCLKNYAGTSEANTQTITFSATTWGYLDVEGEASPNGTTWREYITNTLCWNC